MEREPSPESAATVLHALRRTRQYRGFTGEPLADGQLEEILNVARWSGSSMNWQPWRFLVVRDRAKLQGLAELVPNARHVGSAAVVIAIVMPGEKPDWEPYDEGRVAERILVAAQALGLGAGIGWATPKRREGVMRHLGVEPPEYVRTMISIGHPTPEAREAKSDPGQARKPLEELVTEI